VQKKYQFDNNKFVKPEYTYDPTKYIRGGDLIVKPEKMNKKESDDKGKQRAKSTITPPIKQREEVKEINEFDRIENQYYKNNQKNSFYAGKAKSNYNISKTGQVPQYEDQQIENNETMNNPYAQINLGPKNIKEPVRNYNNNNINNSYYQPQVQQGQMQPQPQPQIQQARLSNSNNQMNFDFDQMDFNSGKGFNNNNNNINNMNSSSSIGKVVYPNAPNQNQSQSNNIPNFDFIGNNFSSKGTNINNTNIINNQGNNQNRGQNNNNFNDFFNMDNMNQNINNVNAGLNFYQNNQTQINNTAKNLNQLNQNYGIVSGIPTGINPIMGMNNNQNINNNKNNQHNNNDIFSDFFK